jgi:hypothetical protein
LGATPAEAPPQRIVPRRSEGSGSRLISAADDLYQTLPVVRHAASLIPHSKLIEFEAGGHLLLGHGNEVLPTVAKFLKDAGEAAYSAA